MYSSNESHKLDYFNNSKSQLKVVACSRKIITNFSY